MDRQVKRAADTSLFAAAIALAMGNFPSPTPRKPRAHIPRMVTASPEEIAAWNRAVDARKPVRKSTLHRKSRGDSGQHPKFPKERVHKQHKHQLRDENGAYTCVGSTYEVEGMAPDTNREHVTSSWVHGEDMGYTARRKWLADISAQRGY